MPQVPRGQVQGGGGNGSYEEGLQRIPDSFPQHFKVPLSKSSEEEDAKEEEEDSEDNSFNSSLLTSDSDLYSPALFINLGIGRFHPYFWY